MKIFAVSILLMLASGCISTAPIAVSWRSNSNLDFATTMANSKGKVEGSVNADKRTELETAVNTSTGNANAAKSDSKAE